MKRRDWLKSAIVTGTAGVAYGCGVRPDTPVPGARPSDNGGPPATGRFRNIIFLAYDGTGYEDAAAAGHFSRRILDRPLLFGRLLGAGMAGTMRTHSLTSVVTDSAAATSAWATGRKVVNGALSQYPDGTRLTTILELAKERGLATGLVTSTRMTHATPAGWATQVGFRNEETEIALQYLEGARPDVLLGGGAGPFEAGSREDGRDLHAEFAALGYDVLRTADDLARSNASRLLGTFTPDMQHLPYEVDRRFQNHPAPSLAALTRKALEVLGDAERGFVLQVEAGRIDHANHANDPGGMIWDWIAAEEALQVMVDFVDARDDTVLIAVPDHDTGGGVVYGFGPWYLRSTEAFETLARRRASHEWLIRALGQDPTAEAVREAVERYLGVPISPFTAAAIREGLNADELTPELRRGHWNAHATQPENTIAHLLSVSRDWTPDRPNIAFATGAHTAGLVPAALYGPMVPVGNLGVIDNTEFFRIMTAGLGIAFENPVMTEEEAVEIGAAVPGEPAVEHAHA